MTNDIDPELLAKAKRHSATWTIDNIAKYMAAGRRYAPLSDFDLGEAFVLALRDLEAANGFKPSAAKMVIEILSEHDIRGIYTPLERAAPIMQRVFEAAEARLSPAVRRIRDLNTIAEYERDLAAMQ